MVFYEPTFRMVGSQGLGSLGSMFEFAFGVLMKVGN